MTHQPDYETLNDGSIDYAHYIRKSHEIRSLGAHRFLQVMVDGLVALFRAERTKAIPDLPPRSLGSVRASRRNGPPGKAPMVQPAKTLPRRATG